MTFCFIYFLELVAITFHFVFGHYYYCLLIVMLLLVSVLSLCYSLSDPILALILLRSICSGLTVLWSPLDLVSLKKKKKVFMLVVCVIYGSVYGLGPTFWTVKTSTWWYSGVL